MSCINNTSNNTSEETSFSFSKTKGFLTMLEKEEDKTNNKEDNEEDDKDEEVKGDNKSCNSSKLSTVEFNYGNYNNLDKLYNYNKTTLSILDDTKTCEQKILSKGIGQYIQLYKEEHKDIYGDWNVFEAVVYADNLVKRCNEACKTGKRKSKKGMSISGGKNSTLSVLVPSNKMNTKKDGQSILVSNNSTIELHILKMGS